MSVSVSHVTKHYGSQKALHEISFNLKKGEICGFLGPNGAGKSTLMKIITGFLTDYEGQVLINGTDIRSFPLRAKSLIGYLPEHNPLYTDMYIREYLLYVARLYHTPQAKQKVDEIVELTGLTPESKKKIGQLSKGYRQRVGLAQAIIHDPEILILDEPMTGLDPNQLEEIRRLILHLGENKTVLLSTHVMQEVKAICDRILIINKGNLVADQYKEKLQSSADNSLLVDIRFAEDSDVRWIYQLKDAIITELASHYFRVETSSGYDPRITLFNLAAQHGTPIIELKTEEKNLEEIFKELTAQKG